MRHDDVRISDYNYPLPDERIARFPLAERDHSRLLVYRAGDISERRFDAIGEVLPAGSLLVFNNTRVIHARLQFFKETGARIEIFCLEPLAPADYERAFAVRGRCRWSCMVGNLKKWKEGRLHIRFTYEGGEYILSAERHGPHGTGHEVEFAWDAPLAFGQLLELLGRIPIPPYLNRESTDEDNSRYQTVYARFEGSVAAPTAGLHFSTGLIDRLRDEGVLFDEVTLHVGAGTFLPVKSDDVTQHHMHTEHFEITLGTLDRLIAALDGTPSGRAGAGFTKVNRSLPAADPVSGDTAVPAAPGHVVAVGTTSVRTLESLAALGWRVMQGGDPQSDRTVGQWEIYDIPVGVTGADMLRALAGYMRQHDLRHLQAATQIMIMPGYRFRVVRAIVTNFHQPQSTLLLLVSAFVGGDWRRIYDYALGGGFRFLSYGDSSILIP